MGQSATSRGIGSLEAAVRKVLYRRTLVCVFLDQKRTLIATFQVAGSGPELTAMQAHPARYMLVGTYSRQFDPAGLIDDARTAVLEAAGITPGAILAL